MRWPWLRLTFNLNQNLCQAMCCDATADRIVSFRTIPTGLAIAVLPIYAPQDPAPSPPHSQQVMNLHSGIGYEPTIRNMQCVSVAVPWVVSTHIDSSRVIGYVFSLHIKDSQLIRSTRSPMDTCLPCFCVKFPDPSQWAIPRDPSAVQAGFTTALPLRVIFMTTSHCPVTASKEQEKSCYKACQMQN